MLAQNRTSAQPHSKAVCGFVFLRVWNIGFISASLRSVLVNVMIGLGCPLVIRLGHQSYERGAFPEETDRGRKDVLNTFNRPVPR